MLFYFEYLHWSIERVCVFSVINYGTIIWEYVDNKYVPNV